MAQIGRGILGPANGTVGTVTAATWKGIEYIRIKSGKRNGKFTVRQQAHLAKFAFVGSFTKSMTTLWPLTFKNYAVRKTEQNYAFSYIMENAVTGAYPNFGLNYPKILVAQGSLTNAEAPLATPDGPGKVSFKWTDNSGHGTAAAADKAILVVYCEELNQCLYKAPAAERQAQADDVLCSLFKGKPVQTWISFVNEKEEVATSIFTGVVNVE